MHEKYSRKSTTKFINSSIRIQIFFFFLKKSNNSRANYFKSDLLSNPSIYFIIVRAKEVFLKILNRDQISIRFKFFSGSNLKPMIREPNKFPFQDPDFSQIRKSKNLRPILRSSRQTDYLESSWPKNRVAKGANSYVTHVHASTNRR